MPRQSKQNDKKKCLKCLIYKNPEKDFYKSYSKWHGDGKLPYCKSCLKEELIEDDVNSVREILRVLDRPYFPDSWEKAVESNGDTLGFYLKNLALNYKDHNYDDSNFGNSEETSKSINQKKGFVVSDEILDRWGFGYTPEEYEAFERKYKKLTKHYKEQTSMHSENLINYIRYRVKEQMATANGDYREAKEWGKLASDEAKAGKLNVSQLSKSDISGGVDILTQLSEAVESQVSVIPLLPKVLEQPYDDVDLILWANINYNRRLEDKPPVSYREIWNFYDEMIDEYCEQKGMTEEEKAEFKRKRETVFRDLAHVYVEPLYEDDEE